MAFFISMSFPFRRHDAAIVRIDPKCLGRKEFCAEKRVKAKAKPEPTWDSAATSLNSLLHPRENAHSRLQKLAAGEIDSWQGYGSKHPGPLDEETTPNRRFCDTRSTL
jgi:hypothetical protein